MPIKLGSKFKLPGKTLKFGQGIGESVGAPPGPQSFLDLGDTPDDYNAQAGKFCKVGATEEDLVFSSITSSIITDFNEAVDDRVGALCVEGEGIDIVYNDVAGTLTFSGENATTTNKGIASFADADFTVASGAVSLKNKTSYLSLSAGAFHGDHPDVDDVVYGFGDSSIYIIVSAGSPSVGASVQLPHGAVVTACIVYGNDPTDNWLLRRMTYNGVTTDDMATAPINTQDTTISNATIDNSAYVYELSIDMMNTGTTIYGARITYTTDYD